MTNKQALQVAAIFSTAPFQQAPWPQQTSELFARAIVDLDGDDALHEAIGWIQSHSFAPTISQFRTVTEQRGEDLRQATAEWDKVQYAADRYGINYQPGELGEPHVNGRLGFKFKSVKTRNALASVTWERVCEDMDAARKEFLSRWVSQPVIRQ